MHLVVALNKDTLHNLDAYIMLQGGEEMARLETMLDNMLQAEAGRCTTTMA